MSIWSGHLSVRGPQDLEDLATAGWLCGDPVRGAGAGRLRGAGRPAMPLPTRSPTRVGAEPQAFRRLAEALEALGLLSLCDGRVACTTVARRHLLPGGEAYLGHSLRYRRRLAANWSRLADAVRCGGSPTGVRARRRATSYQARVRRYLLAMDDVARHKARRIGERVHLDRLPARADGRERFVLDLAGGGGGGGGGARAAQARAGAAWWSTCPRWWRQAQQVWAGRGRRRGCRSWASICSARLCPRRRTAARAGT